MIPTPLASLRSSAATGSEPGRIEKHCPPKESPTPAGMNLGVERNPSAEGHYLHRKGAVIPFACGMTVFYIQ